MIAANLAVLEGEVLHLTLLGRACATSSLTFESALRLFELMGRVDIASTPAMHILANIQVLSEADALYVPIMKRGRSESTRLNDVITRYGHGIVGILQRYAADEFNVWQRCKRAAILWDWVKGVPIDEIEKRYTPNIFQGVVRYGDIIRIAEGTRFHLRSAHQILTALYPHEANFLNDLDQVLLSLELGLPTEALKLVGLPIPLTRGQYLNLYHAGHTTTQKILQLPKETLLGYVGAITAERLVPSQKSDAA